MILFLALLLYGSVARHEEGANSDLDLMAIIKENRLEKRHEIRCGVTVEFLEMSLDILQNFIDKNEVPMYFALAEGILLFDKNSGITPLIAQAKAILEKSPPANKKWEDERYRTKKRSDLTEIYTDLLDIEDEIVFNYVVSLLIAGAIPLLLENSHLWTQSRKKTMENLRVQCHEGYTYIEVLLSPTRSLPEKRAAAERLIEYVLKPYGGILKGESVIFRNDGV